MLYVISFKYILRMCRLIYLGNVQGNANRTNFKQQYLLFRMKLLYLSSYFDGNSLNVVRDIIV